MNHFSGNLPLHYQLAQSLRSDIVRGVLSAGQRLAPELRLGELYGVSVITVQRALRTLEQERLITRHRGRGTFVSPLPPHLEKSSAPSVIETMFSAEFRPHAEILERQIVPTPQSLQRQFVGVKELMRIRRLVRTGDQPFSYTTHYLPVELGAAISIKLLRRYPMFRILREHCRLSLKHVSVKLEATTPPFSVAQALQIESGTPVMYFTADLFDSDERVVNVPEIYYRGDRYTFQIDMPTDGPIA